MNVPKVLTLTVTATPKVVQDICREFYIEQRHCINTGFYRPNLSLKFTACEISQEEKMHLLAQKLNNNPVGPTIIYVTLQKTAEKVADFLVNCGFQARAYHSGMKNEIRDEIQDWFMASEESIVVATIAFGMGIDKSNIRYIYHFNMPKSLENYSQEKGFSFGPGHQIKRWNTCSSGLSFSGLLQSAPGKNRDLIFRSQFRQLFC